MDQDQVSIHKEVQLNFGSIFGFTLIHPCWWIKIGSKFEGLKLTNIVNTWKINHYRIIFNPLYC